MADKSKIMSDIKKLGPVDRMSPVKKKRYDTLMKLYQTLSKQDKNKAKSIQETGKTSANDTEDPRYVTKNNKNEKIVKGTMLGNTASNEASRNTKVNQKKTPKKFGMGMVDDYGKSKKKEPDQAPIKKDFGMGQMDDFKKAKVKQGPPPPPAKQKKLGFFDRIKSDFNKAVSETKRNFQGDAKKKTGRYKSVNERNLDSKGNYKGTNIKPTKLQESRMKKPEKNTMDFGAKKKKAATPMYESKGTKGGVKKSKYYSGGGTVFTGR